MSSAPIVKPRKRAGSFETFCDLYQPLELPDGLILREREQIPDSVDQIYIWTVVDDGRGRTYVTPGWHFVNRIGYVWCERPWSDIEFNNPGYHY